MGCLSCYKTSCDFVPNCMDLISGDMVEAAVLRQLAMLRGRSVPMAAAEGSTMPERHHAEAGA